MSMYTHLPYTPYLAPIRRCRSHGRQMRQQLGIVLPVVLVILVILTALIVTQVRRTTVDQRLAANAQESLALNAAAKTVLGWCEAEMWIAHTVPGAAMPRSMVAPMPPAQAAWQIANNWNNSGFTPATDDPLLANLSAVQGVQCLIEDATGELEGAMASNDGVSPPTTDCRWRKYRTTAQVRIDAPDFPGMPPFIPAGQRGYFVQGEMRIYSNLNQGCV